jgi:glycosyltransferase involved in cell wall biosynthesis
MSNAPLFSVIILHYNQEGFLYDAVDSLLSQSYGNIEFIFADDCSSSLDAQELAKYVETHKRGNLRDFVLQINKANVGTVRNVNSAIKKCKGRYILFFAADDCLYDADTIQNFVESFQSLPDDRLVVTGQCYMFDEHLKKLQYKYLNEDAANRLNQSTAQEQFLELAFSCVYAIGATAVKRELFDRCGYIDERYAIIEDWSYFLHITREGTKVTFCDFDALRHRDGGVSHHKRAHVPPHVLVFKNDDLLIQEYEILPYLTMFPLQDQRNLLLKYRKARIDYAKLLLPDSLRRRIIRTLNPCLQRILSYSIKYTQSGLKESMRYLPATFTSWASFEVLSMLLRHFDAGLSQSIADTLVYRILYFGLTIVLAANGAAVVLLAVLSFLNYCRRSLKKYFSDRSLKTYLSDREKAPDSIGSP